MSADCLMTSYLFLKIEKQNQGQVQFFGLFDEPTTNYKFNFDFFMNTA
jgi:hypothetical protein